MNRKQQLLNNILEALSLDTLEFLKLIENRLKAGRNEIEKVSESRYSLNETLKQLALNSYYTLVHSGGQYKKQFDEVMEGFKFETTYWAAVNIFSFGVICGIREQRKRQKLKKQ